MTGSSLESESQDSNHSVACNCDCGKSKFQVSGRPLLRFYCHCTICQEVYQKPYSDFVIVPADNVMVPKLNGIQFKRYKAPPAVNRGKCPSCRKPVLAWFKMIPGLPLAMLPSSVYPQDMTLPTAKAHIFYDKRVSDIEDEIPKYSGYLSSEWQVFKNVLTTLR